MKNLKKVFGFAVVFMVVMVAVCSVSLAADPQYTENLIPVMTSNTAPSGVASSSENWAGTPAWKAFDGNFNYNDGSYRAWGTTLTTGWLSYEFSSPKIVTKYTITISQGTISGKGYPKSWTFDAWNGSQWVSLDKQTNITNWSNNTKNSFTFSNSQEYIKYRINITANGGGTINTVNLDINELEMMGPASQEISAPTSLTAIAGDTKVDLKWDAVEGATSYNIKRATTSGGPYTTIATSSAITYQDIAAKAGTTYYYIVTAVNASGESTASNEVSATVTEPTKQLKLVIEVKEEKQLSISDELSDNTEMTWSSADSSLASVDANGMLKGLKPGNTVITCTSADKSYTESINVLVVNLEYQLAVDLNVGEKCRLTVDDLANSANETWTSYDPTIATISAKGKVTAVSEGLTYIVASDKDGKEIGRIYIRVRK